LREKRELVKEESETKKEMKENYGELLFISRSDSVCEGTRTNVHPHIPRF